MAIIDGISAAFWGIIIVLEPLASVENAAKYSFANWNARACGAPSRNSSERLCVAHASEKKRLLTRSAPGWSIASETVVIDANHHRRVSPCSRALTPEPPTRTCSGLSALHNRLGFGFGLRMEMCVSQLQTSSEAEAAHKHTAKMMRAFSPSPSFMIRAFVPAHAPSKRSE